MYLSPQDIEVLRAWLADLHFEEYYNLFIQAGYDMPTISRMTPEVSTARRGTQFYLCLFFPPFFFLFRSRLG